MQRFHKFPNRYTRIQPKIIPFVWDHKLGFVSYSKPKFSLEAEKDANRSKHGCILLLLLLFFKKKEILILKTLNEFFKCTLRRNILRKGFFLKQENDDFQKTIFKHQTQAAKGKLNHKIEIQTIMSIKVVRIGSTFIGFQ